MQVWKIIETLKWITNFFETNKIENSRVDAEYILSAVLDLKRFDLYLNYDQKLTSSELKEIKQFIVRRANHEPLQYILQTTNFFGFDLFLNKNVLIPRSETELMVEEILKNEKEEKKILEIGIGSGAISIALKKNNPLYKILATDISEDALEIARRNITSQKCEIETINSDIFLNINLKFDVIVSNPPYISEEEYKKLQPEITLFEPKIALTAPQNGLEIYIRILKDAKKYLTQNGKIYFEIGHSQISQIAKIAKKNNFEVIKIIKDYNDFDRIIVLR